MTHVLIDMLKLAKLPCGLGEFSLHLGQGVLNSEEGEVTPAFLMAKGTENLVPTTHAEVIHPSSWRKESVSRWLHAGAAVVMREPWDVWHATSQQSKYYPLNPSIPVVLTIHDLSFLRDGDEARITKEIHRLQRRVDRAAVITTGSNFAAGEIRQHLKLNGKPVRVIYYGPCLDDCEAVKPNWSPSQKFLLALGQVARRKQLHLLVEMLPHLADYDLLIAGPNESEYAQGIQRRIVELGLEHRVRLPGRVTNEERQWLYQNCAALVFPSKTEGFGLPLIEAMTHGRPVFAMNATSLPEIGGPLGFYWNETAPMSMAKVVGDGMKQVDADPTYAQRLKAWAAKFTWKQAAADYTSLYRELHHNRHSRVA